MASTAFYRKPDRFLYAGLLIYGAAFLWHHLSGDPLGSSIQDETFSFYLVRLPGFTLVAIVLTQVIFDRFRCSPLANLIAILILLFLPITTFLTA